MLTKMLSWSKEHTKYYQEISEIMNNIGHKVKLTILIGRGEEIFDKESFQWKVLEDNDYPYEKIRRATYVFQEQSQVSFISVIIDPETNWVHGVMLTSIQPMNAKTWLNIVSTAECISTNNTLPGNPIHKLLSDYGTLNS